MIQKIGFVIHELYPYSTTLNVCYTHTHDVYL